MCDTRSFCLISTTHFDISLQVLCSRYLLCTQRLNSIRMCAPLRPQTALATCRLYNHTAVKTISFNSIQKRSYLMDTGGPIDVSFKVVHLMRVLRAVLNSRIRDNSRQNWAIKSAGKHAQSICRDMLRNIKYAVITPAWLHGLYTLIRYEDESASNPGRVISIIKSDNSTICALED